jgi:hypothetical protein
MAPAGEDLPRHGGQGPGGGRGLGAEPATVEAQPGPGRAGKDLCNQVWHNPREYYVLFSIVGSLEIDSMLSCFYSLGAL